MLCCKFSYTGRETRIITKLFKDTDLKIAYTTNNNLKKLLNTQKEKSPKNKYNNSEVYQLNCPTCQKKYIGQTDRPFHIRFQAHYRDFKYANNKSKFAQYITEEDHSFGRMNEIMDSLHVTSKGRMLDSLEKFYIFKETKSGNQFNDKLTIQANPIFEAIVQNIPHREP